MQEIVLPTSPNWFLSSVSSGNVSGLYAFGARNLVFVYDVSRTNKLETVTGIEDDENSRNESTTTNPLLIACFHEHVDKITSVCLSPDPSQWLCCSSDENTVKLWDIRSHITVQTQNEHKEKITCMTWCPRNTDLILTASEKGTIVVWKLSKNTVLSFRFEKEYVYSMKASPHHESQVAVGYRSGLVLILDISCDKPAVLQKLRGHDAEVTSICWCPLRGENWLTGSGDDSDGVLIATASRITVKIWRSTDGKDIWFKKLPQGSASRQDPQDLLGKRPWLDILWHRAMPQYLLSTSSGSHGTLFLLDIRKKNNQELEHLTLSQTGKNKFIFNITAVGDLLCTFSLDRMISVWSLKQRELLCSMSSFGGHVYCIRASPVDPGFIAIGVGDSAIRIWNQGNKSNSLDITSLYFGTKLKITTLAWHPEKEGILAFGTDEGRVGICNVLSAKSPVISSTYHGKTVYVVCWAPPVKHDKDTSYQVYSVGDGTILQHFIGDSKKSAVNFLTEIEATNNTQKEKFGCSELFWRRDFTAFAVGYDNGYVTVHSFPSCLQVCRITAHNKIINCIRWHPESTSESPSGSQCKNWIAQAGNGKTISVLDLSHYFAKISQGDSTSEEVTHVQRQVETHSHRITDLCWSPHHDGRLVSVGYDNIAIIWNMKTLEMLASYSGHSGRLLTAHWSCLDPDIIMTGGFDGTLRVWKVSSQPLSSLSLADRRKKKKPSSKPVLKVLQSSDRSPDKDAVSQDELNELQELILLKKRQLLQQLPEVDGGQLGSQLSGTTLTNTSSVHANGQRTAGAVSPPAPAQNGVPSPAVETRGSSAAPDDVSADDEPEEAPGVAPTVSDLVPPVKPLPTRCAPRRPETAKAGAVAVDKGTSDVSDKNRRRKQKAKSLFPVSAAANNRGKAALQEDLLDLTRLVTGQGPAALVDSKPHLGIFADKLGAHRCLLQESEYHLNNDNMEYHLQLELWRGNIAGAVQIARQRNELSDWIVAMAPLASHDLWELVSAEYAEQLEEDGQYHKAATYLLAAHKVYQAIDLFRRHRLYREAVSLARIRLSPVDPLLEDLYTEWGQNLMKEGLFEQAAKCYLAMRHIQEAGKAVARRYDQASLKTACHMTLLVNDKQQGLSYAYKLFTQNLLMGEWQEAYKFLAEHATLKVLLPLLSTHELLVHHLSILCPSLALTQKPVTADSFSQWCKTDETKNKISLPEFLVDKSDADPVVPWEPYLIGGHTFPHHLLNIWHQHLDITMVTQELTAMHTAISQLLSLRQSMGDAPNLLILVSMDVALCLLVLLTSETSTAIVHLLQAMSTLHSSNNQLLLQALCRLILPQGPKYMLKLQQEFNASRVLITMESHGDVDKAGGEGHNSIKKFVTDIKDDGAITMSSVRCRELDCLRAFYYLAVLEYLQDGFSSHQQEEDILDGMPNGHKLTRDMNGVTLQGELKELPGNLNLDKLNVTVKCCDTSPLTDQSSKLCTASSPSATNISHNTVTCKSLSKNKGDISSNRDPSAKNLLHSPHITTASSTASSSPSTSALLLPGSRPLTDSSSPVDPPCVPSSIQPTSHPSLLSHQSINPATASKTATTTAAADLCSTANSNNCASVASPNGGQYHDQRGQLTNKNLLRLSKGILWDVQAKREALTETLGYIHSAIAQHLLANRSEEMSHSSSTSALSPTNCSQTFMTPSDGELEADGCCHQSRHFSLPLPSPTPAPNKTNSAMRANSFQGSADATGADDISAVTLAKFESSGCENVERAKSLSPQPSAGPGEKVNRGPFRSKSESSSYNLSVQLDSPVAQVEQDLLGTIDGTSVAFQKSKTILWHDTKRSSVDESLSSPKPASLISKMTPDGSMIPLEWVDLPVDVKYFQSYITLSLLKHEQEVVTQELKRVPNVSQVPFPSTIASVRRLLHSCLNSPHLVKDEKLSYFKQLNDWAMLFAVTTHQQHETSSLFNEAHAEHFKD